MRRYCLVRSDTFLAYFYCDFRDAAKQCSRGLLSHLLVRLAAEFTACAQILFKLYLIYGKGTQTPSDSALEQCLQDMLRAITGRSIYIIIDALDECQPSDDCRSHFSSDRAKNFRMGLRMV